MLNPILRITDGTDTVDLLDLHGWLLNDWQPAVPEVKGGGVFRSSPLVDGRKLAYRKFDNITDTFNLIGSGRNQNIMIASIQKLQDLLEKAVSYWTSNWQNEMVWIEAKAANESNMRYATIVDYRLTGFGGPYKQPFFASDCNSASEAILVIEHMIWQETKPGDDGICVELHSETEYPDITAYDSGSFTPSASGDDGYYAYAAMAVDLTSDVMYVGKAPVEGMCQIGMIFDNVTIPIGASIKKAKIILEEESAVSYDAMTLKFTGQSQVGGSIASVAVVNGGSGYRNPIATVYDTPGGTGHGAKVIASQDWGVVTGLTIIDRGIGYVNPTIIISDKTYVSPGSTGGSGATASITASAVNLDAAVLDGTIEDFVGRSRTTASVNVSLNIYQMINEVDITSIIAEIVANANWNSGDSIGIFLESLSATGLRHVYSWDSIHDAPTLEIEWSSTVIVLGRDTTCAAEVYVSNKHNNAQVNYIYAFDDSGGTYSLNMYGWDYNTNMPLFQDAGGNPFTPAVGDRIYFGSCPVSADDDDYGQFSSLVFDIYSRMTDVEGVWKYYNGAAWTAFDVTGTATNELCGDQILFFLEAVGSVVWEQSPYWDTVQVVDGVDNKTGYWVCFEVTAVGGSPVGPYQQHRDIYTVLNPYIDIDEDKVPGNIPALARVFFNSAACWQRSMNTLVMGLRSLSRGDDFRAYLNASDIQNPVGLVFAIDESSCGTGHQSIISYSRAPTGRCVDLTGLDPSNHAVTDFLPVCKWTFNSALSTQYIGSYHAYVRCYFLQGDGTMKLRLRAVFGEEYNEYYSNIGGVTLNSNICAVDLGQISILPTAIRSSEFIQSLVLYLETKTSADLDYGTAYIYDIILIPADEWSGCFGIPKITGTSVLTYGSGLDVDGITTPKQYRAMQYDTLPMQYGPVQFSASQSGYTADWSRIASSEPIFQDNADQRLWFLQYKHQAGLVSNFENCGAVRAERSARYLLMRGNQ